VIPVLSGDAAKPADYMSCRIGALSAWRTVTVDTSELAAMVDELDKLRAAAPTKKSRAKKAAAGAGDPLPDWMPVEAWAAFIDMRVKIKKPMTDYAQKLMLKKLAAFYANDLDPSVILNQSIMNGWQDLYAPKEASTAFRGAGRAPVADQVAAAMKKRREGDGDGFMGMTIDV